MASQSHDSGKSEENLVGVDAAAVAALEERESPRGSPRGSGVGEAAPGGAGGGAGADAAVPGDGHGAGAEEPLSPGSPDGLQSGSQSQANR